MPRSPLTQNALKHLFGLPEEAAVRFDFGEEAVLITATVEQETLTTSLPNVWLTNGPEHEMHIAIEVFRRRLQAAVRSHHRISNSEANST